jgi:hypothetical protein
MTGQGAPKQRKVNGIGRRYKVHLQSPEGVNWEVETRELTLEAIGSDLLLAS